MTIREQMQQTGKYLFRWRGYAPLPVYAVALVAVIGSGPPAKNFHQSISWEMFCLGVGLFGLAIRALTVGYTPAGTSGRNKGIRVAHVLNSSGAYSLVRHPLYVGNYFLWLSVALLARSPWVPIVCTLVFWLCYERIIFAEEEFLAEQFGEAFHEWARRTPTLIPAVRAWDKPPLPFSFRNVLRREYHGLTALIAMIFLFEAVVEIALTRTFRPRPFWLYLVGGALLFYFLVRFIDHQTGLLKVDGR